MGRVTNPLPRGDDKVRAVRSMFDTIAPRYDLVNRLMTFRMDVGWRRKTVAALGLADGAVVADLACGTGDLCDVLAGAGYRAIGVDLSEGMLRVARHRLDRQPLALGDALRLPLADASVDGVTCGFALRNFASLPPMFAELARTVRPGGRIALLEVAEPSNPILRFGHAIYFGKIVPLIGGLLSDRDAYRYLPRSVEYLPPVGDLLSSLERAGLVAVERRLLSGGIAQLITASRKGLTP